MTDPEPPAPSTGSASTERTVRPEAAASNRRQALRGFLGLPAAASIVTLLSASCLLAGVWSLVAPTLTGELIGTRCVVVGVLACYLGALSAVVAVLCRWQAANPDALGASLVGCLSVIGLGVSLDLLMVDAPGLTVVLACAAVCLAIASWLFWNRCSGGRTPLACLAPLLLLLSIHCAWSAFMGQSLQAGHGDAAAPRLWTSPMGCWTLGWGLSLVGGVMTAAACLQLGQRDGRPAAAAGASAAAATGPYLSSARLRALLTLVLSAGTAVQAWVVGYSANLDLLWSDLVPLLALLLIGVGGLLGPRRAGAWDALALAIPAGCELLLHIAPPSHQDLSRGPAALQQLLDTLLAPEQVLVSASLLGAVLAWRLRRGGYLVGAAVCTVAMVTLWQAPEMADWHMGAGLLTALGLVLLESAWRREWRAVLTLAVIMEPMLLLTHADLLPPSLLYSVLLGLPSLTVLLAGLAWKSLVADQVLQAALWSCLIATALAGAGVAWPWQLLLGLSWMALVLLAWHRRRRPTMLLPLAVPGIYGLVRAYLVNAGWLGIALAFALLALVVAVGRLRLRLQAAAALGPGPAASTRAEPAES